MNMLLYTRMNGFAKCYVIIRKEWFEISKYLARYRFENNFVGSSK